MAGVFAGLSLFFVGVPILLIAMVAASARPAPPPANTILSLDLRGAISDQSPHSPLAFLNGRTLSVASIVQGLRQAETDTHVKALLVRLPEGGMAPGAADEIRNYEAYDYVLINRDLGEAEATLSAIVRAERVRRTRIEDQIRPILDTFSK